MSSRNILGGGVVTLRMSLMYMLKRKGPSGLPCLTPLSIGIHAMLVPIILVRWLVCVIVMALIMWVGMPADISFAIIICRFTLSKALEKSTRRSQESCRLLSRSSIDHMNCSYCRGADRPLMAPYCVGAMSWLRSFMAWSMVSS